MAYGNKGLMAVFVSLVIFSCALASEIKESACAGTFYPASRNELSRMLDQILGTGGSTTGDGGILGLICPHAGYVYSGQTAACGYRLIKGRPFKTAIIIGTSHRYPFEGISVYAKGAFSTPLGAVNIDETLAKALLGKERDIVFEKKAFDREHSVEVQIPFLQKVMPEGFMIVPVVTGDCSLDTCRKFAGLLNEAIGQRQDVVIIVSSDMYHGYLYREAETIDKKTIASIQSCDAQGLYEGLRNGTYQLCGGFGVVSLLYLAKEKGCSNVRLLNYTNSQDVTGTRKDGVWTVGYSCFLIDNMKEVGMLTVAQKKKLLGIARNSLEEYLKTGKRMSLKEDDPLLTRQLGAFVTLHERGQLRGCIGNIVGRQPLYLTIRDMAVEAGVGDPRFAPVTAKELKDLEIEISVLSPLEKVASAEKIQMGVHGVLVKKGYNSGVFLPQVATEQGWTREQFLSYLCEHKAGLSADAWKDPSTELFTFTAEVFNEKGQ